MTVTIAVHATCTHGGGRNARIEIIDMVKSLGGKFTGETYSEIYLEFDAQHTQAVADKIAGLDLPVATVKKIV